MIGKSATRLPSAEEKTMPAAPRPLSRLLGVLLCTALGSAPALADPPRIDFAHDIVPILKARCAECHTNGTYKGGLSFDTREALLKGKAAVPGESAASELIKRVIS